jgi:hypothetical protein
MNVNFTVGIASVLKPFVKSCFYEVVNSLVFQERKVRFVPSTATLPSEIEKSIYFVKRNGLTPRGYEISSAKHEFYFCCRM